MHDPLTRLLDAFHRVGEGPPADLATFLRSLPEAGELPTPWETWTLIGLVRHRDRQYWVREIINTRLRGDPSTLAALGALGHPEDVKQSGSVPGMPEWEYYFHGRGCCLTHKVRGEAIDVDFHDDTADYFDTFFYVKFLESLRDPEPPERRLRELHRSFRPLSIAIPRLLASGALVPFPGRKSHPFRLASAVLDHNDSIDVFCEAWSDPAKRLWLAALIGDWPAAHDLVARRPDIESITASRAQACCRIREEQLQGELQGDGRYDALRGLADLGGASLRPSMEAAFRGPPSGLVSAALEIAGEQDDPSWCPHIHALFSRLNPAGPLPEPHNWINSLKYLLVHDYRKAEAIAALPQAGGSTLGEATLLALEHAPEHALALIRKGLLSHIPVNRTEVAAILALMGKPWSMRELLRALEESDDQEKTADARAALLEVGDEAAQKAVVAWEQRNPHEDEPGSYLEIDGRKLGPFYSMGEISLKNRAAYIRYEMTELHDRVMKVRDVVPPEPRPWWKLW